MHTTKSLEDKKNYHIVFSYNKTKKNHFVFIHKTQKVFFKKIFACTLALITSLSEP
jgi:hypothetical protein